MLLVLLGAGLVPLLYRGFSKCDAGLVRSSRKSGERFLKRDRILPPNTAGALRFESGHI